MKKNITKTPLVTVITATYNLVEGGRSEQFAQCLESVRKQSYTNIEHLIIDGSSADGTLDIVRNKGGNNQVRVVSEPDAGIYDAMNKGLALAKGKYVAFLNSDDYYHNPQAVELSVAALEKESADFSFGDLIVTGGEKEYVEVGDINQFVTKMPFGHPTMFARLEVLRRLGGFDEGLGLPADYDLVIRLILGGFKCTRVAAGLATYRIGGLGSTTDHSDEIGKIYLKNYSKFYPLSGLEQAKKIMYGPEVPAGFPEKFRGFAESQKLNNALTKEVFKRLRGIEAPSAIPVFLSSDNRFSPFIATTILSIMDNTAATVNFYVLDGGIWDESREKIVKMVGEMPSCTVEFLDVPADKKFRELPTRLHFTKDMYSRFLIPDLRPELDKAIYSDVDVIFCGDIAELYREDLGKYSVGAVPYTYGYLNPDQSEINEYHKRLPLNRDHKYFESGLLIIDSKRWRDEKISEEIIKLAHSLDEAKILTPDQDILNVYFNNNYAQLDNRYIVVPKRTTTMLSNKKTAMSVKEPFIIHYAGPEKPWLDPDVGYSELFWSYAARTPYYQELLEGLKKVLRARQRAKNQRKRIPNSMVGWTVKLKQRASWMRLKLSYRLRESRLWQVVKKLLSK